MIDLIFIFYFIMTILSIKLNNQYTKVLELKQKFSKKLLISTYNLGIVDLVSGIVWGISLFITYDIYISDFRYFLSWILIFIHGINGYLYLCRYKDLEKQNKGE